MRRKPRARHTPVPLRRIVPQANGAPAGDRATAAPTQTRHKQARHTASGKGSVDKSNRRSRILAIYELVKRGPICALKLTGTRWMFYNGWLLGESVGWLLGESDHDGFPGKLWIDWNGRWFEVEPETGKMFNRGGDGINAMDRVVRTSQLYLSSVKSYNNRRKLV